MSSHQLNSFINSRYCLYCTMFITVLLAVALLWFSCGETAHQYNGLTTTLQGIAITLDKNMLGTMGIVAIGATGMLMGMLNTKFAFIREFTVIYASALLLSSLTNPDILMSAPADMSMSIIVLACSFILFSGYQEFASRSYVFLISLILSFASIFQYSVLFFIVPFFIGFGQMQLFSFKNVLAMILGLATPYWIGIGFNLIPLESISFPALNISFEHYGNVLNLNTAINLALTIIIGTTFGLINIIKIMNYRLQLRSYNGFFNVLAIFTMIFAIIDIDNVQGYLTILNVCMSYQIAHFFTIQHFAKRYILFLAFAAIFIALAVINILNII